MANTVRIMPKQPIEAEVRPGHFDDGDTHYTVDLGRRIGVTSADWVEVTEYVWDGTHEALEAIRAAFEGTANYASRDNNPSAGWGHSGCLWIGVGQESSMVPSGWRIQPFGDTFVILPPEVTA